MRHIQFLRDCDWVGKISARLELLNDIDAVLQKQDRLVGMTGAQADRYGVNGPGNWDMENLACVGDIDIG